MENLPPVKLGAAILFFFAAALIPRWFLEKRWVEKSPMSQSGRQMAMDLVLVLIFGLMGAIYAHVYLGFPRTSAILLYVGFSLAGFFIAVDMALHRERKVLTAALDANNYLPPKKFYSVTRKFALVAISSALLTTFVIYLVVLNDIDWLASAGQDAQSIAMAQESVGKDILFIMLIFMALAVNMIWSYSRNLKLLFENETNVLESVSKGDLTRRVPVATNDEFGVIAGHTNIMIQGLSHRQKLLGELALAEEVQQNLLPQAAPTVPGLDLAGTSRYSSQTGGDYFDFITLPDEKIGLLIADASGHGVGSALHMATARSIFRTLALREDRPAKIVTDMNRQLTQDTWETGRFMTFSYTVVDLDKRALTWVRAGHDPAFLYDPKTDAFEYLDGRGVALGLHPAWEYEEYGMEGFTPGKVLVIATDGIWESANAQEEMFGKKAMEKVIRQHAKNSASNIMEAILDEAQAFRAGQKMEDDMTIIVAKAV
ncbi:SpoIIE family protein phosphatase [Desulfatibacillum aliphaticivorans]|uniref:SpoIIE family protein phosphatase n=1 Tax=Desulfatibacillum aliphaticivorans TaxID=218208 RepID=UPI00068610B2